MTEAERRKLVETAYEDFLGKVKSHYGEADAIFGWAERLQCDALRYATEEFVGMMDVGPASAEDVQKYKQQITMTMDAIAASNKVLCRGEED